MTMMVNDVEIRKEAEGRILLISVSGVLEKHDYEFLVPEIDKEIEAFGKIRILFDLVGFHGWTMGGLFEDTKFAITHYKGIERLAFVGDKRWEKGMAAFCKPFTKAEIRYFDIADSSEAKAWLREGLSAQ